MKIICCTYFLLFAIILCSCNPEPQPISYGKDNCAFCRMTIVDNKYGAEIITKKGKVYKFDSAECMIRYMKTNNISEGFLNDLLVVDHTSKGMLTDAASAYYLLSDSLHSPMGAGLTAFSKKEDMQFFKKQYNGENYVWEKVVEKINAE